MQQNRHGPELLALVILAIALVYWFYRPRWKGGGWSHGTSRWATPADMAQAGMLGEEGLILGRTLDGEAQLIRMPKTTHLSVFAPTGAGKGVSLMIPWAMGYQGGSVVIFDPKGEIWKITAKRRESLGQKVVRLDPFSVCGPGGDTLNVLDLLSSGEDAIDDARMLGDALVVRTGEEKDPHWADQASNIIASVIAFTLTSLTGQERSLVSLREIVTNAQMLESATQGLQKLGGGFARMAGVLTSLEGEERASVLSSVNRHSVFLDSPAITRCVESSTVDIREILQGTMSLYVILPPYQMESQSRWLRLVLSALIRLVGREGMAKGQEAWLLLDEAGQLGHMGPIEQALTLLRGYGLHMALFYQSLGQIRQCFKDKEAVLLDNTEQIYFGVNSLETAERVSKMLGEQTITVESSNESTGRSWQSGGAQHQGGVQVNEGGGSSLQEQARSLLQPSEVLTLDENVLIAFLKGVPPICARRLKYYQDPLFVEDAIAPSAPPRFWHILLLSLLATLLIWWLGGKK